MLLDHRIVLIGFQDDMMGVFAVFHVVPGFTALGRMACETGRSHYRKEQESKEDASGHHGLFLGHLLLSASTRRISEWVPLLI